MRIIDKKTDFYDYLQHVYPDNTNAFDRRESYVVKKDEIKRYLSVSRTWDGEIAPELFLLQACNTLWLFALIPTKLDENWSLCEICTDFEWKLLKTWKNYSAPRVLLKFASIEIEQAGLRSYTFATNDISEKTIDNWVEAINHNNIYILHAFHGFAGEKPLIPLLGETGLASLIDDLEIYNAIDEYFSKEKDAASRTESIGLTDKEKIVNHGFDTKTSFRGKNKR